MILVDALKDKSIDFVSFSNSLKDRGIGDWDNINSTDTIKEYISDKMNKGIHVSHMLQALEDNKSTYDVWKVWLGSSLETPVPINSKQELIDALGLGKEDLEQEIYF